jgi:hypothetical protein
MTVLKATALAGSLVGAVALGVVIRPYVVHDLPAAATPAVTAPASTLAASHAKPASEALVDRAASAGITQALVARVKPLLKSGTDMNLAMAGFTKGQEFAAVAHAADNLDIPFVLLKHRMLDEHMTLSGAIKASRPDVAADIEATRARAEARADVVATMNSL